MAESLYIPPKDWTPEQVQTKLQDLINHVECLDDNWRDEDLRGLINVHGVFSPELAWAALEKEVYCPNEIYYHAPEDVRDGLIAKLLETEDPRTAENLMCCLAMQGDDKALETLYELEQHPRPWRKKLYADPSEYAQCGGWTFDKAGKRHPHFPLYGRLRGCHEGRGCGPDGGQSLCAGQRSSSSLLWGGLGRG